MKSSSMHLDKRIILLKAVQEGKLDLVKQMIRNDQSLINAKTKTKNSSLLHVAAERCHKDICEFLLQHNHEINPIDNDGMTPFQRSDSFEIRKLLVLSYMNRQGPRYLSAKRCNIKPKEKLGKTKLNILLKTSDDFVTYVKDCLSDSEERHIFGVTRSRSSISQENPNKFDYQLDIALNENIFMLPYYGDFLLILENEQAMQILEEIAKSASGYVDLNEINKNSAPREARSYAKAIADCLQIYPFLKEPLKDDDKPEIKEVKKMFISFGLLGFASYVEKCSHAEVELLRIFPYFDVALKETEKVISKENSETNVKITDEMFAKYGMKKKSKPSP